LKWKVSKGGNIDVTRSMNNRFLKERLEEILPFVVKKYKVGNLNELLVEVEEACGVLAHCDIAIPSQVTLEIVSDCYDTKLGEWKQIVFKLSKGGRLEGYELRREE
jgi:hypothetical protein